MFCSFKTEQKGSLVPLWYEFTFSCSWFSPLKFSLRLLAVGGLIKGVWPLIKKGYWRPFLLKKGCFGFIIVISKKTENLFIDKNKGVSVVIPR